MIEWNWYIKLFFQYCSKSIILHFNCMNKQKVLCYMSFLPQTAYSFEIPMNRSIIHVGNSTTLYKSANNQENVEFSIIR